MGESTLLDEVFYHLSIDNGILVDGESSYIRRMPFSRDFMHSPSRFHSPISLSAPLMMVSLWTARAYTLPECPLRVFTHLPSRVHSLISL